MSHYRFVPAVLCEGLWEMGITIKTISLKFELRNEE